jgi:DNA-binding winged helix-turn-helix (wHTH) protein
MDRIDVVQRDSQSSRPGRTLVLGRFVLDRDGPELLCDGQPVAIRATPLRVLVALSNRLGRTVSKDELMEEVWPGLSVSDASLATAIRELRKVLGDDGARQPYIETLRNRGYRLTKAATPAPSLPRTASDESGEENPAAFDLLIRLGRRLYRSGRHQEARAAYREAAQSARRDGDDGRFIQAVLEFGGDLAHTATGPHQAECVALLEEAIARDRTSSPAQLGARPRTKSRVAAPPQSELNALGA